MKNHFLSNENIFKNKNNTVADFRKKIMVKHYLDEIIADANRIGYLVITKYNFSKKIRNHLFFVNNPFLLISKGKIKKLMFEHFIDSKQIISVLKKARKSPDAIVFDIERNSYQFYVSIKKHDYYRVVFEFGVAPIGIKDARVNILVTLFKNNAFQKRIRTIERNEMASAILVYKKKSGWASIATDSSKTNLY